MPSTSPNRPSPSETPSPRWRSRSTLEVVACVVIGIGLFMLLQPFALVLYTWSFVTILAGTVMFMVVSKFPE
ncbi:MAG: hypothetical protein EBZ03_11845 [Betaproteobacteria bacterium]|nr:hypothetical protein [Betaproteobacteria bacterium]NBO45106.1 hypothetical protein [Betaproteobacteria bacterium]NBP11399.1 hypothetical protein [Betaproteobacteria bacterium]NBQ09952.1 hypothetical protein [Betaproteobacteria bacterium]NBQ79647.1 hypothetical protein [Betaproteobacteria bacterium]